MNGSTPGSSWGSTFDARVLIAALSALVLLPVRAAGDPLSAEEQAAAHALYLKKCARCHKLYEPAAYEDAAWGAWMVKMRRKARLKPAQYDLLVRYLDDVRHQARRP